MKLLGKDETGALQVPNRHGQESEFKARLVSLERTGLKITRNVFFKMATDITLTEYLPNMA